MAELGYTYSNALQLSESCYCVSDCFDSGTCWANIGCQSATDNGGWKELQCSGLQWDEDPGTAVANADWGFEYRPLTVVQSDGDGVSSGRSVVDIGPLIHLRLYDIIPFELFPSIQLAPKVGTPGNPAPAIREIEDSWDDDWDDTQADDWDDTDDSFDD